MSEKLYRIIETTDILDEENSISKRCLVFLGPNGSSEEFFSEDRTSLMHNRVLYDWHGRQVELEQTISKVLYYFGPNESQNCESFVVQLKNQRLAIADLYYTDNSNLIKHNCIIINPQWDLIKKDPDKKPFLRCREWSFANFLEPPTSPNCLDEINKHLLKNFGYTCKICSGVTPNNRHSVYHNTMFIKTHNNGLDWIENRYTSSSREYFPDDPTKLSSGGVEPSLCDLQFSEDGSKMTAFINYFDCYTDRSKTTRISTDIDIILRTHTEEFLNRAKEEFDLEDELEDSEIFWYYDPEP